MTKKIKLQRNPQNKARLSILIKWRLSNNFKLTKTKAELFVSAANKNPKNNEN